MGPASSPLRRNRPASCSAGIKHAAHVVGGAARGAVDGLRGGGGLEGGLLAGMRALDHARHGITRRVMLVSRAREPGGVGHDDEHGFGYATPHAGLAEVGRSARLVASRACVASRRQPCSVQFSSVQFNSVDSVQLRPLHHRPTHTRFRSDDERH